MSGQHTPVGGADVKEEEETDELLLMDEEMLDAPPEDLPRRLLTNFAVYNAEVGSEDPKALITSANWLIV